MLSSMKLSLRQHYFRFKRDFKQIFEMTEQLFSNTLNILS
jgi:hypothetical protein